MICLARPVGKERCHLLDHKSNKLTYTTRISRYSTYVWSIYMLSNTAYLVVNILLNISLIHVHDYVDNTCISVCAYLLALDLCCLYCIALYKDLACWKEGVCKTYFHRPSVYGCGILIYFVCGIQSPMF